MTRALLALAVLIVGLAAAAPASAGTRFFAYTATDQATRYRTGDVTLELRTPDFFFGPTRVVGLWRRRGADLPLGRESNAFSQEALSTATGRSAQGLVVYAVDEEAGRGFAQGSCVGAPRAWIAVAAPQAYQPLVVYVLRQGSSGAPELCETLNYAWQAEWRMPPRDGGNSDDGSARPVDPAGRR